MVLIDNERFLKVTENINSPVSEESAVKKPSSNRFSSATSQIVIFGEIARLTNFANKNVHIEFWLEPSRGWFPYDGDDRSLCGLTHRCYSSTSTTSVGAPFQFIVAECNTKSNESEISNGFTLYFRVVNNHSLGRSSSEAFGILKVPFRPGNFSREIKLFRPHSTRISDKLMEYFLNYSFDLDELEENHYEPLGLIHTESKGTLSLNVNTIVQSSQFDPKLDEYDDIHDPLWSDISQIVAAFRRARQRMIFLRMKALQLFKNSKKK